MQAPIEQFLVQPRQGAADEEPAGPEEARIACNLAWLPPKKQRI